MERRDDERRILIKNKCLREENDKKLDIQPLARMLRKTFYSF